MCAYLATLYHAEVAIKHFAGKYHRVQAQIIWKPNSLILKVSFCVSYWFSPLLNIFILALGRQKLFKLNASRFNNDLYAYICLVFKTECWISYRNSTKEKVGWTSFIMWKILADLLIYHSLNYCFVLVYLPKRSLSNHSANAVQIEVELCIYSHFASFESLFKNQR